MVGARVGSLRISLSVGDIAASEGGVIVNAANSEMLMDLGVKLILEAFRTFASFAPRHVRDIGVVLYDTDALARWHTILRSI